MLIWRSIFAYFPELALEHFSVWANQVFADRLPGEVTRDLGTMKYSANDIGLDLVVPILDKIYQQKFVLPSLLSNRNQKVFNKLFNQLITTHSLPRRWTDLFLGNWGSARQYGDILAEIDFNLRQQESTEILDEDLGTQDSGKRCPKCHAHCERHDSDQAGDWLTYHLTPENTLCSLHGQISKPGEKK